MKILFFLGILIFSATFAYAQSIVDAQVQFQKPLSEQTFQITIQGSESPTNLM